MSEKTADRDSSSSEQQQAERRLRRVAGPVLLWGLGVGSVISGEFFGWNFGLAAGGFIVRPSNASFSGTRDLDDAAIDLSFPPDSGVHTIEIDVYNFGYDAQQARLDVDAVGGLAAPFALAEKLPTRIGAEPGGLVFSFNSTGLSPGEYSASLSISVSDEDLQGESSAIITLEITVTIGDVAMPADLNGDGVVNGLDLGILLANWSIPAGTPGCGGAPGSCSSDLNGDGLVDGIDLGILLANWTI